MNEQACAFVCAFLALVCAVLSGYALFGGEWDCMVVTSIFGGLIALISGFVLAIRALG